MKRMLTGTCLAVLCAAGLSAQTGATQPPASKPQDTMKTVTATGCLRAGEAPNTFVLSNVKWDEKSRPTGTAGSTAAAPAASLKLVGSPAGVQLSEHIGHTVEVTGNLDDKPPSTTGTAGEQTARKPSDKPEQTLNLRTLKMVSSSCESR